MTTTGWLSVFRSLWWIVLVASGVLGVDYASKLWALANLQAGVTTPFLPWLIDLTLVTNTGTAFGMWRSEKLVGVFLPPLICLVIVAWIINRELKERPLSLAERVGFGMILGGAAGNMLDRLLHSQVTDFLLFAFWRTFPVFNVADALIDAGVVLILLQSNYMIRQKTAEPEAAADE